MNYKTVLTDAALQDIKAIHQYIQQFNPSAASRLAVKLLFTCDNLVLFPRRGSSGRIEGTRELFTVKPYVIVFRIKENTVEILRIRHTKENR